MILLDKSVRFIYRGGGWGLYHPQPCFHSPAEIELCMAFQK